MTEQNNKMPDSGREKAGVPMAGINGAILFMIGLLILATPFTIEIENRAKFVIDVIAGLSMSAVGLASLLYSLYKNRRRN